MTCFPSILAQTIQAVRTSLGYWEGDDSGDASEKSISSYSSARSGVIASARRDDRGRLVFHSSIYSRCSPRVQELLISTRARVRRALREGRQYRDIIARARDRECWSSDELLAYQQDSLRKLLKHSAQSVPYYSRLFDRLDFKPGEAKLPDAIRGLPYMSKRDILEAGNSLMAKSWGGGRVSGSTSGTTGTPVTIVQDFRSIIRENSFIGRQLEWAGYISGEPRAWIRGDMIVPSDDASGRYWRLNYAENMLMMSSYHMSDQTAAAYIQALTDFGPTLIQAYPSSIAYLARYLESRNSHYQPQSRCSIVTSSETLTDEDRRIIEDRFRCKVFDWYGAFERVAAIGTCEEGSYHLLTDYSYVELEPDGEGLFEIIGTGFNNRLMPLIRFRTGDLVEMPESAVDCTCGRAFPVVRQIHGRQDDYIKLSSGRRIGRLDHIFKGLVGIAEAQVVQDELDAIRILVVPFEGFSNEEQLMLMSNARQRLGSSVNIEIEIVSSIPRTSSGKFLSVVCNI